MSEESNQHPCARIGCDKTVPPWRGKKITHSDDCEVIYNRNQGAKRKCIHDHGIGIAGDIKRREFVAGLVASLGIPGLPISGNASPAPLTLTRNDEVIAKITALKIQLTGGSGAPPLHYVSAEVIQTVNECMPLMRSSRHLTPIQILERRGDFLDLIADAGLEGSGKDVNDKVLEQYEQSEAYWHIHKHWPKLGRRLIQKGNQHRIVADGQPKKSPKWWGACRDAHECYTDAKHILRAAYDGYNGEEVYPLLFQAVMWELRLLVVYFEETGHKVDDCFAEFLRVWEKAEKYSSPPLRSERNREEASYWITAKGDDGSRAEKLLLDGEREIVETPAVIQSKSLWYSHLRPEALLYADNASMVEQVTRCLQLYLDNMQEQKAPLVRNVRQWQQFEQAKWFQEHNIASRLKGLPLQIQPDALPPSISSGILPNLYAHELYMRLMRSIVRG